MRTKEVMFPLIEAWEKGDTTRRDFCEQHGLPYSVFQYWYQKYKDQSADQDDESPFIRMEVASSPEASRLIRIQYPDGTQVSIAI